MEEKILLERHKRTGYTVWYNQNRWFWAGSKGDIVSKVKVPREVYDYLAMSSNCFKNGELILGKIENEELKEDLENEIYEKEESEANSLTKEEIVKILNGTVKNMKSKLQNITSDSTKQFVLEIAKEIGLSNSEKQKFIKDWIGCEDIYTEEIFEGKEEE